MVCLQNSCKDLKLAYQIIEHYVKNSLVRISIDYSLGVTSVAFFVADFDLLSSQFDNFTFAM